MRPMERHAKLSKGPRTDPETIEKDGEESPLSEGETPTVGSDDLLKTG